jgi:hypothetical protein
MKKEFCFKPWHFVAAIALFCAATWTIAQRQLNGEDCPPLPELHDREPEWSEGVTMLLFYRRDSDKCRRMRRNVARMNRRGVQLYAVDAEENDDCFYRYNVSGVPCLLIFDGYIETKRVMGVVSTANLEKITNRIL